jgi:BTB/POZ domain-containing protein 9
MTFVSGLSESNQTEIHLTIPLMAFKSILRYIYSGYMSLSQMKEENILDILGLSNQWGFEDLELAISDYLKEILSLENVCAILDCARLYNLSNLENVCLAFMDINASRILRNSSFRTLSQDALRTILHRDSFFAEEVEIFEAVNDWYHNNLAASNAKAVFEFVRLPLMTLDQLLKIVRPIIEPEKILDAISEKQNSKYLPHRGILAEGVDYASHHQGSKVLQGEPSDLPTLLDGEFANYDTEKGYTRHSITDSEDEGIVVELGNNSIINHIKILLWDHDSRSYSYFIELSVDQRNWERVIDYSTYYCRSWQYLYFPATTTKYIRLVGTHNTINRVFHVVSLEAYYSSSVPTLVNGLIAPNYNVARVELSACVIEGVSRSRNALLNGDVKNYDWDSGYTCHQLGGGYIIVQLGQPYYIGSMRLLLWDCDERTYSFYIETSTNMKTWEMAVDRRNDQLRSFNNFTFQPRPVVFVKIAGTNNTANEIFHLVHLELPWQEEKPDSDSSVEKPSGSKDLISKK